MKSFSAFQAPKQFFDCSINRRSRVVSDSRTQLNVSRQLYFCQAKSADSEVDKPYSFRTVPSSLLAAEKEEAKAVLSLFLRKQGLSNAIAARTINKSDHFIAHLISRLHSDHKSRYLVGLKLKLRELFLPSIVEYISNYRVLFKNKKA